MQSYFIIRLRLFRGNALPPTSPPIRAPTMAALAGVLPPSFTV